MRLLGLWPALSGLGLIAFSPFHIAHSRLLHLDGLVSSLMLLSVLALLAYLQERRVATAGTVAAGLVRRGRGPRLADTLARALSGAVHAVTALAAWTLPPSAKRGRAARVFAVAARRTHRRRGRCWRLVFVLLWPAMWVDPIGSLRQVLDAAGDYAAEGHLKPTFFDGEIYAGDPGFWFYPITYLWRTTPITLLGLILALVGFVLRRDPFAHRRAALAVAACCCSMP